MTATSPFAIRGVLEGFYGRPWSHAQRLDMIAFIADLGMNTFVYTPKDDPLLRRDWQSTYDGTELARLSELIDACRARDLRFVYCLSPGLSIEYSSARDIDALVAKFLSVAELGATDFGLMLDDIPFLLLHESDRRAFPDLASAHGSVAGAIFARMPARSGFVVCPTIYCGRGDDDYVRHLGALLDPRIEMFWTGRMICSPSIDCLDAAVLTRSIGRLPLYWDNYPVNDLHMMGELHVGPYRGREAHLGSFASGVVANGMEFAESSKIAFATIADYLADPATYEPEESWARAITRVAGADLAEPYAVFADNVRSSCLSETDAPAMAGVLAEFVNTVQHDWHRAGTVLDAVTERLSAAAHRLLAAADEGIPLAEEARPWLRAFQQGVLTLQRLTELARSETPIADWGPELLELRATLRGMPKRVFGSAIDMALTDLLAMTEVDPW